MRHIPKVRAAAALTGMLMFSACVVAQRPRAGVVYVQQRPPTRIVEVLGVAPSRAYVWVSGRYDWRGREYVWIPGRYEMPRAGFVRYEEGRWVHSRQGWYFVDGRWRE